MAGRPRRPYDAWAVGEESGTGRCCGEGREHCHVVLLTGRNPHRNGRAPIDAPKVSVAVGSAPFVIVVAPWALESLPSSLSAFSLATFIEELTLCLASRNRHPTTEALVLCWVTCSAAVGYQHDGGPRKSEHQGRTPPYATIYPASPFYCSCPVPGVSFPTWRRTILPPVLPRSNCGSSHRQGLRCVMLNAWRRTPWRRMAGARNPHSARGCGDSGRMQASRRRNWPREPGSRPRRSAPWSAARGNAHTRTRCARLRTRWTSPQTNVHLS
jgi:hypothetical protein